MKPSPHFAQHHDLEAPRVDETTFRPAWRVRSRLEALLVDGAIGPREWFAAVVYRHNWEAAFGHGLKSLPEAAGASSRAGGDHFTVRRLDALTALRMVSDAIGRFACELIQACVVHDVSWCDLGSVFAVDPKTARTWTIAALEALADHSAKSTS